MDKKVMKILQKLHTVVFSEEKGNSEYISEYFSSKELEDILSELGVKLKSNIQNSQFDEIIDDFLSETMYKRKEITMDWANEWLNDSDLNTTARKKFIEKLGDKFPYIYHD